MESEGVLAVKHVGVSSPAAFALTRLPDGKSLASVSFDSPYKFAVAGQPKSDLVRELRWYLEGFLDYPFHPETLRAEHTLDALQAWGYRQSRLCSNGGMRASGWRERVRCRSAATIRRFCRSRGKRCTIHRREVTWRMRGGWNTG